MNIRSSYQIAMRIKAYVKMYQIRKNGMTKIRNCLQMETTAMTAAATLRRSSLKRSRAVTQTRASRARPSSPSSTRTMMRSLQDLKTLAGPLSRANPNSNT